MATEMSSNVATRIRSVERRRAVKSKTSAALLVLILLAELMVSVRLIAQAQNDTDTKHHRYRLVDLGTFGGPTSRNDGIYPALNDEGTVIGMADTNAAEPFYPIFNPHGVRHSIGSSESA